MAIAFTEAQMQVIQLHNSNILVSAAAGSGKTAVLVERIVRMVCDEEHPIDIDRLLIVTFTNAAAAEMRERIGQAIAQRLSENPHSVHLQRQSTLLHNALITTIDSFSLLLIKNHFHEIGLDPAFRVADEGEIKLLRREVLEELLEDSFREGSEDFLSCVETFCPGGKETLLEQYILDLSLYAASFPWPKEWLEERKKDYEAATVEELLSKDTGEYLFQFLKGILSGCLRKIHQAVQLCEQPDGPYMYGAVLEEEQDILERIEKAQSLQEIAQKLSLLVFKRLPSQKDDSVSAEKREEVKAIRASIKDAVQMLTERFFSTTFSLALEQSKACRKPVNALIELTLEFDRRMQEKKQEKKLIDFSDMEHYALDILLKRENGTIVPSAQALEYREFFYEILIDEYQDSNLVQEYLLQALSGEEQGNYNRFMVGDIKQSIYKFRLARPELFLEKYHRYGEEGALRRIDLSQNFRSRKEVIETVNALFGSIMNQECGGIEYDEKARLYLGAAYPESKGCESELLLVEKPGGNSSLTGKQAEALAISQKIKELLRDFQVLDKQTKTMRPARFRDIVILLRSNSGWDETFKKVMEDQGIPVSISSKTGYFAANEVQEVLNVLRILDNPLQDIPFYGVMKSVFGGFSEEEIAYVRGHKKEGFLYEAVKDFVKAKTPKEEILRDRLLVFLDWIEEYRGYTIYLSIRDLLQKLIENCDYLNYVTALPGGSKRRANIEMLFTKASDFEKTSYFGLFHFIRYLEQLEKYDVDFGEADTLDENADVVRIMSIHKSKGLEFPITFVAGLSKRINMQDTNQSLVLDMDLGIATDYVDVKRRIRNKSLRRNIISCKMREDNLAEELRVLYVALTRAKEKLIMTATVEQPEEKVAAFQVQNGGEKKTLDFLDFYQAGSYLDFILPVVFSTPIKVQAIGAERFLGEDFLEQTELSGREERLRQATSFYQPQAFAKVKERFARKYPFSYLEGLYTKTTVSELKIAAMSEKDEAAFHSFEEKEITPYIPGFRTTQGQKVSGPLRGNAFHKAMELLDFEALLAGQFSVVPSKYQEYTLGLKVSQLEEQLSAFLTVQAEQGYLPKEYLKAIAPKKIVHFLQSELGFRMWLAQRENRLYREQPFVLGIEASRLKDSFPGEEKVLIQGIIDAFFVEEKQIILLDYKTDVITDLDALWNRYQVQVEYYGEALERLMGLPVKEKILYSFHLEKY